MASIYRTATKYAANNLTLVRGTVADITSVGVYHTTDPTVIPAVADFTLVQLVQPGDPLAEGTNLDVLSLIGTGGDVALPPGDYQRWILWTTATEKDISRPDTLTIL